MPDNPIKTNREWLFNTMSKGGYNVGKDQADFDSLLAKSPENRQWLYDTATKSGINVGKDLSDFEHLMGWDNQSSPTEQNAQAGQQTAENQVASAQEQSTPETAYNPYHVDVQDFKPNVQFGQKTDQPRQDFTPATSPSDVYKTDTTNAIAEGSERARSRTSYEMNRDAMLNLPEEEKQKEIEKAAAGKMLDIIEDKQNPINEEVRKIFPDYHYVTERTDRFDTFLADYRAKDYNLGEIDRKLAEINKQIADINRQTSEERNAQMGASNARFLSGYGNGFIPDTPGTEELQAARRALERAKKLGEEAKRFDQGDTYFMGNVGRGMKDKFWDDGTWDWGRADLRDAKLAMQLKEKIDRGEELTQEEHTMLGAMAEEAQAEMATHGKQTRGYKAGETTMFMLPFMLEMAANPTVAGTKAAAKKLAIEATDRIARYAWYKAASRLGQGLAHYLTKGGVHLATAIPGGVAQAATTGIQRVEADYIRRRLGEVVPTVNANGEVEFQGFDDSQVDSEAWAAYKALMQQGIENATEILGAAMPVGKALSIAGRTATASAYKLGYRNTARILAGLGENVAPLYNYMKNWPVANILEKGNWNGNIEEWMEEQIGMVLNGILGVEDTFTTDEGGMFNLDNQIDTMLGVGLFGTFVSTAATGSYAYNRHQARKKMAQAERLGTNLFGEHWAENKQRIENANTPEALIGTLDIIARNCTTAEKVVLFKYADALQRYRAVGLAELAKPQRNPGQPAPLEEKTDDAFSEGAEASTPEEIHAVAQEQKSAEEQLAEADSTVLQMIQERMDAGASNTELQQVMESLEAPVRTLAENYIASRAKSQGVAAGAEQRAEQEGQRYSLAVGINEDESNDGDIPMVTTGYYKEQPYYVRSIGGDMAVLADAKGEIIEVPAEEVTGIATKPIEELVERHTQEAMDAEQRKAEFYLQHNAKTQMDVQPNMVLQNGNVQLIVTGVEGNEVTVVPATYDAEQGGIVPKSGESAQNISLEEAYQLQDNYYDSIDNNNTLQAQADAQQPSVAGADADIRADVADTGTGTDGNVGSGASQAEATGEVAYPTDKQGKTDYTAIEDPEMMASAAQAEFGTSAPEFLDAEIAEAQAVIDNPKTANVERFRARKRISMLNGAKSILAPEASQTAAEEPRYSVSDDSQQQIPTPEEIEAEAKRRRSEEGHRKIEAMKKDIETLSKALGVKIDYEEGLYEREGCNGKIDGTHITLDPAFPEKSLEFLLGHELTHRMQDLSPELYQQFKMTVINVCPDFAQRREKIRSLYERAGFKVGNKIPYNWDGKRQISLEQIDDEAIADYVGEKYQVADGLEEFIIAMQQPTILRKLMEFANWVLQKLTSLDTRPILHMQTTLNRAFFNAAAANAAEAQAKAESKPTRQAEPQQTVAEEAKEEEQKPAQENKNKRKDNAKKRKKRKGKRYSIATAEEIQQMVDKEGLTEDEANTLADHGLIMDGGIVMDMDSYDLKQETGYKTPNELTDLEEEEVRFSLGTSGKWKEQFLGDNPTERQKVIAEAVMSWYDRAAADDAISGIISKREYPGGDLNKDGKGALRKNVEYVYTFDLDTTCPRTLQYLGYAQQIERQIGRPLSQKESVILTETMRAYGQQMPCVYCYAENKRQALKQYFLDFMAYRNNVLNASSEKEARDKMYGHNSKGNLSESAEKVLAKWRDDSVSLNSYRPTMEQLYKDYMEARDSVLVYLDYLKSKGEIDEGMSDKNIAKKVLERYGINSGKEASVDEKNMASTISTIVNDWRYDELEGSTHKKYDDKHVHVWVTKNGKNAFALWNEMTKYGKSASSAHNSVKYYPYTSELLDIPEEQKAYINGMSGLRMHSSNDFRIDYLGDYLQLIADMDKGGWLGHTYTKNPAFVRIFGNTGYRINMSIAGYDINGKVVENRDEGHSWDDVKELRRLFPNAGTMFMTTSSLQLDFALNADWVDMIIPFHNSGLPKAIWYDMRKWEDAQSKQNEKLYSTADKKAMLEEAGVKIPKGAKADAINQLFDDHFKPKKIYDNTKEMKEELWDAGVGIPTNSSYQDIKNLYIETFGHECEALGTRKAPHFLPYDTWVGGTLVPGHNNDAKRYLELCKEYGCHPRFKGTIVHDAEGNKMDITEHPNYIRVIKETARTDTPQTPVKFNLDEPSEALGINQSTGKLWTPLEYAFNELQQFAWTGGYSNLEKDDMGVVNDFLENVIKWDEEHPDNPRQLDFISKEAREYWNTALNITKSAAERAAMTEHAAQTEPIPYHPNPETGEMLETPNEEKEAKKKATTKFSLSSDLTPNQRRAIQMVNPMAEVESDTHYSISEKTDREYLDAVEAGDMEKAQQMVREAAKAAMPDTKVVDEDGNPMVVYHGTEEEFTVFKKNSETGVTNRYNETPSEYYLFADEESPASDYGDTKGVYLNAGNLLQADSREIIEQIISEEIDYINSIAPADQKIDEDNIAEFIDSYVAGDGRIFAESNQPENVAMESWSAIQNAIADYARNNGYDGFVFNDSTRGEEHHTYAVFDSNQIKSADPVTYDDSGNVIPLSERFNESNEDIRYSLGGLVGAEGNEELMDNLYTARDMEEAGKDAKEIWWATGWERGKDNQWRFEIPEGKKKDFTRDTLHTVGDMIDAPELFKYYPEIKDYKIKLLPMGNVDGSAYIATKTIKLNSMTAIGWGDDGHADWINYSTLIHEIQHIIQHIEGFARGGNMDWAKIDKSGEISDENKKVAAFAYTFINNSGKKLINAGRTYLISLLKKQLRGMDKSSEDYEPYTLAVDAMESVSDREFPSFVMKSRRMYKSLSDKEAFDRYRRLAGETEARNVGARATGMTENERRNTQPSATEDVPREDQIVRYSLAADTRTDEEVKEFVESAIGDRLALNGYDRIIKINPFWRQVMRGEFEPYLIDYREVYETPTLDDYYIATETEFKPIWTDPEVDRLAKELERVFETDNLTNSSLRQIRSQLNDALYEAQKKYRAEWEKMRESGKYEWHKSPLSSSEYLIDRSNGDIFRKSNHWGKVSSCRWNFDGEYLGTDSGYEVIGKSNIKDFKPLKKMGKQVKNPAFSGAYIRKLEETIRNYEALLASKVHVTDGAKKQVQDALELYRKLEGEYRENGRKAYKDVRYSLSTQLDEQYPGWNDGSTKENGGDNTQVTNTKSTYVGIGKWMLDTGQKNKSVLDASSGLGLGTQALREMGIKADDVEPYATSDRLKDNPPTYTSYADIDKQYDIVISNVVLNVIPDDWREGVVKDMAEHTKPGGKMIVAVRPESDAKTTKNKIELEDENELLVLWPNGNYRHYQKFWTQKELEEDMRQMLGEGWKVERATPRNSGLSGKRAVVCTRTEDGGNGARPELTRNQRMAISMVTGEPLSEEDTRYSIASKDVADASRFFATDYDVVGEKFKNRNGTVIKRGGSYKGEEFPVGKVLSSNDVYVHKDYANDHMKELEEKGKKYLPEGFKYNCLMYNPKSPDIIRFDEAPGFDKEREPFVGRYIKVDTKEGKVIDEGNSKAIWHGKWQWVGNDYKGFDVREAYEWQRRWASTLNEIAKGGSLPAWNRQLEKFGLPVDEAVNGAQNTRYSIASDGTLVGVHNISEAKLNKAINMGGLVNPSLAVVDTDNGQHTGYGEISLIAPSELVDRKTGRNIGTFDRDAYTPTFPVIEYFSTEESDANEDKLVEGLEEGLGEYIKRNFRAFAKGNAYDSNLEYIFLKEKHPELLPQMQTIKAGTKTTMEEISARFFDGKEPTYEAYVAMPKEMKTEFNLFERGKGEIDENVRKNAIANLDSETKWKKAMAERLLNGTMDERIFDSFIWNVKNDAERAGKPDYRATVQQASDAVRDNGLSSEFEEYKMMTVDNMGYDQQFQVGWKKDGTRNYKKNTLANVSSYMRKQGQNAAKEFTTSSPGALMARVARRMDSLGEIRENRGRLISGENTKRTQFEQDVWDASRIFVPRGSSFSVSDDNFAFDLLADVIDGKDLDKVVKEYNSYHKNDPISLTKEQRELLSGLRERAMDIPAHYFETKFERPVTLDEFAAAVVPNTITPRIEKGLRDAGLPVYKYDPETSGSREEVMQKAISQEPNTRFSIAAATAPTFYSNAGHAVEQISQNKATPEQWEAMLRKNGGLKAEEDKWLGLTDWLHEQTGTVTKQQILDYINTNDIEVKDVNYSQYGVDVEELRKNYETAFDVEYSNATYQEEKRLDEEGSNEPLDMDKIHSMALAELDKRAPDLKGIFTIKGGKAVVADQKALDKYVEENGGHESNSMHDNYVTRGLNNNREIALVVPSIEPYTTGNLPEFHYVDDYAKGKAIAWVRFGDTYDENNNRVLVIDEVQSQRHQDGRESGYRTEADIRKRTRIEKARNGYWDVYTDGHDYAFTMLGKDGWTEEDAMKEFVRRRMQDNEFVPDAPFRNNWQELAMKRMLRYAAENGYDKLAWTYGKQQAKRYGLSSKIDRIAYTVRENGKIDARAYLPNGNYVFLGGDWKEIEREVGKEMAARMKAGEHNGTENLQWGIDSDFNPLMYDYNVIKGEGLEVGGKGMEGFYDKMLPNFIDKYCKRLGTKTQDIVLPRVEEVGRVMHSIDITPEMRDYVLTQGQPRYSIASGDVPAETIEAWDRLARSQRFQLRETMFDYLTAVDKFQEFIAKENRGRVMDYQNAYIAMLALSSRNKAEMDVVDNMLVAPLNQIIKKITGARSRMFGKWDWNSGELRKLDMYLKAKHGLERNRDMAVREALAERLEMELSTARNTYTDAKELRAEIEEINKRYRERLDEWYEYLENERNSGKEWLVMQKDMDEYAEKNFGADLSKDYAGLSGTDKQTPGLFPDADDWMEAAYDYVFGYEVGHQQADIDELWHRIGAISQYSLNKQNQSGLTSAEYVTEQTRRYQFYVPLRGWNADIAQDEYDYIDSRVGDFGNPIKKARGRQSEAGNVMGALLNIAYRSISTGNKNLAMQKFYNLVSQFNTNGLAVINSRWMELVDGEWTEVAPQIPQDATPEEVAGILARFEGEMEDKRKNGEAKRIRGKEKMAYKTIGRQKDEHQVRVYIGGEERVITVTGNPRIAQALNGLTNPSVAESDDWMEEKNSAIRNFMAGAFTSKNMAFSLRNLSRDTIHANNYAFCMENFEYWWRFTRNQNLMVGNAANMVKMMRLISGYNKAKTPETEDERLFKEFMENGGATGYTYIQQQDELAKELADMLQKHDKSWANPADYARRFFELTEFFGNAAELSNRFAAYKTSRQMGRSVSRAVSDAKEITLNFNRKGAGKQTKGETSLVRKVASMTNFGRRFILFFNANMQGKYQLLRMLEKHPVKTVATRLVAPAVFMGAMMPIINNVILPAVYQLVGAGDGDDGDDDNYFDSLTDHERSSYLCFRLPNKAGWLKIPLPPDITPMTEMGDLIGAAANGSRDLSGMDVTKCTVDMMSPVNINWGSGDNVNWTAFGLSFAPTAVQPIGQAMTNTNYLGRNIYRKSFTSYDTDPEYRKTYRSTSPLLKELSRVANNLGGGTDYTTSDNIMDVNPALVQHFITSYLGGYGTTAVDITNALYSAYTGEDTSMTIQKVPVVSSFVVFGNKDVTKSRIESAYGEVSAIVNKMKDKESNMRAGYKEAEEMGDVERAAKTMTEFNRMREGYDYKFYSLNKEVVKFIKKLDKSSETSVLQENLKYQLMKELTQMYRYRKPGRLNAYDTEDGMQITIDTEDKDGNVKSTPVTKVR